MNFFKKIPFRTSELELNLIRLRSSANCSTLQSNNICTQSSKYTNENSFWSSKWSLFNDSIISRIDCVRIELWWKRWRDIADSKIEFWKDLKLNHIEQECRKVNCSQIRKSQCLISELQNCNHLSIFSKHNMISNRIWCDEFDKHVISKLQTRIWFETILCMIIFTHW